MQDLTADSEDETIRTFLVNRSGPLGDNVMSAKNAFPTYPGRPSCDRLITAVKRLRRIRSRATFGIVLTALTATILAGAPYAAAAPTDNVLTIPGRGYRYWAYRARRSPRRAACNSHNRYRDARYHPFQRHQRYLCMHDSLAQPDDWSRRRCEPVVRLSLHGRNRGNRVRNPGCHRHHQWRRMADHNIARRRILDRPLKMTRRTRASVT